MAKKKVKKAKKAKRAVRALKAKKAVKARKAVKAAVKGPKEKVVGRVEHFFDKISVAAVAVKSPFKVGDHIHLKGHTTDFVQRVDSMQIEHQPVQKVKKGDDTGIKVSQLVREHDMVYLADKKSIAQLMREPAVQPAAKPAAPPPDPKADPYAKTKFLRF